jgi:hypothetical protein
LKRSLKISKLMVTLWVRELKRILDSRIKIAAAVSILFGVISLAALGGYQITSLTLTSFLGGDAESLALLTLSMYLNASIFVSLFFIVFKAVTPDQDQLSIKLSWFPVTRFERNVGYFVPFISILLLLVLFILSIILIPAFLIQNVGLVFTITFFTGLLLQAFFTLSLMHLLYNLIHFLVTMLKLPFSKFFTLFLLIGTTAYYSLNTLSIQGMIQAFNDFDYHAFYLIAPLMFSVFGENTEINQLFLVSAFLIVAMASFASLFLVRAQMEKRGLKVLRFLPIPRKRLGALISKEIKSQWRSEENLINFALIVVLLLFANAQFNLWGNPIIMFALAAIVGIIALNSFGQDKKMISMYKIFGISPHTTAVAKMAGLILLSLTQFLFFSAIALSNPLHSWWQLLIILINSTALFYLAGTILPVDRNSPHTGLLSFLLLVLLVFPLSLIANYLVGHTSQVVQIGTLIIGEGLLIAAIFASHQWRYNHE